MRPRVVAVAALLAASVLSLVAAPSLARDGDLVLRIDHRVPHVSTVPANSGDRVQLFVRERVLAGVARTRRSSAAQGKVVLFVHGGTVSSVPDYDLDYKDYNWMAYLAQAGFDVFSMDQTGYGGSPRPTMDDPCNMNPVDQPLLIPNPLPAPCPPTYPFTLTTSQSDWDEMDTVVDFIRALTGVDRVSIIGWSGGGPRGGGYAARHPEKVDKLFLYAPGYSRSGRSDPPATVPSPGFPMGIQTHDELMFDRWQATVTCGRVDPGIRDVIWSTILSFDTLGAMWGTPPGLMRTRTAVSWGWNATYAARVTAPTLIIVGEQDSLLPTARMLYDDLVSVPNKVRIEAACATHFMVWEEPQHRTLLEASKSWLLHGSVRGASQGTFRVDEEGRYHTP
jgi:pimeloyl-ACP methyl ester carboxylesterase